MIFIIDLWVWINIYESRKCVILILEPLYQENSYKVMLTADHNHLQKCIKNHYQSLKIYFVWKWLYLHDLGAKKVLHEKCVFEIPDCMRMLWFEVCDWMKKVRLKRKWLDDKVSVWSTWLHEKVRFKVHDCIRKFQFKVPDWMKKVRFVVRDCMRNMWFEALSGG